MVAIPRDFVVRAAAGGFTRNLRPTLSECTRERMQPATAAATACRLVRGAVPFGQSQRPRQMVLDLRQRLTGKFFEIGVIAVLDLILEERRVALLIIDLAVHIVAVEGEAAVGLERGNHRNISAM